MAIDPENKLVVNGVEISNFIRMAYLNGIPGVLIKNEHIPPENEKFIVGLTVTIYDGDEARIGCAEIPLSRVKLVDEGNMFIELCFCLRILVGMSVIFKEKNSAYLNMRDPDNSEAYTEEEIKSFLNAGVEIKGAYV